MSDRCSLCGGQPGSPVHLAHWDAERYTEKRLDMEEAVVVQTIDTWTGEIADQRSEWKEVAVAKTREPMGLHIALSAAQLESAGIPEWMPAEIVEDCLDQALLSDDTAFQTEVNQWIEDHEEVVADYIKEFENAHA